MRHPRWTHQNNSDPERVAQSCAVRPFQGRIVLPSRSGGGAHFVRSAPGYCLYPLRGLTAYCLLVLRSLRAASGEKLFRLRQLGPVGVGVAAEFDELPVEAFGL